jgi:hypothetical protein
MIKKNIVRRLGRGMGKEEIERKIDRERENRFRISCSTAVHLYNWKL